MSDCQDIAASMVQRKTVKKCKKSASVVRIFQSHSIRNEFIREISTNYFLCQERIGLVTEDILS